MLEGFLFYSYIFVTAAMPLPVKKHNQMLFLDKEQITADKLAELFGVPIQKIEKAPVFEINPSRKVPDPLNKSFKAPYGKGIMAVIFVKHPKTKKTHEIRFATSVINERVGDKLIEKYEPRKVNFRGVADLKTDIDEAVFFYLHPQHKSSPFRTEKDVKPWYYDFVDNTARAEQIMDALDIKLNAMNHVKKLSGTRLTILAKGMGIKNVDNKEPIIVKSELMDYAEKNPAIYLGKADRQATLFDGMIQDAIDKDVFHLDSPHGIRRWRWNAGSRINETIVDVLNVTQDATQVLMNHIKANINEFWNDIQNVTANIRSEQISDNFLEKQDMSFLDNDDDNDDDDDFMDDDHVDEQPANTNIHNEFEAASPAKVASAQTNNQIQDGSGNRILNEEEEGDIIVGGPTYDVPSVNSAPAPAPAKPAQAKAPAKNKSKAKAANKRVIKT